MRTILSSLFITLASQVAAEEVYYCQGLELAEWSSQKQKLTEYTPQNFKFSIKQNQVHFGSGGFLDNTKKKIRLHTDNLLHASDEWSVLTMDKGNFNYAIVSYGVMVHVAAKCDKF